MTLCGRRWRRRSREAQALHSETALACQIAVSREGPQRVVKRPSAGVNMRLLSLNRGATHGNCYADRQAATGRTATVSEQAARGQEQPTAESLEQPFGGAIDAKRPLARMADN